MNATDRIVEEFDRLVTLGRSGVATRPSAERVVYYVVSTRCEIDINGFASVYEQGLNPTELAILVDGLRQLGKKKLVNEFQQGFKMLERDGFYEHLNWNKVADSVKAEIDVIGERIGDQLWDLDEKLASILNTAVNRSND